MMCIFESKICKYNACDLVRNFAYDLAELRGCHDQRSPIDC